MHTTDICTRVCVCAGGGGGGGGGGGSGGGGGGGFVDEGRTGENHSQRVYTGGKGGGGGEEKETFRQEGRAPSGEPNRFGSID